MAHADFNAARSIERVGPHSHGKGRIDAKDGVVFDRMAGSANRQVWTGIIVGNLQDDT